MASKKSSRRKGKNKSCGTRKAMGGENFKKAIAQAKRVAKILNRKCLKSGKVGVTTNLNKRKCCSEYAGCKFKSLTIMGSCHTALRCEEIIISKNFNHPKLLNVRKRAGTLPRGRKRYTIYFAYKGKKNNGNKTCKI